MVNVFNELVVSEVSAEDQIVNWKHDTRGIFNCFKGARLFIVARNEVMAR